MSTLLERDVNFYVSSLTTGWGSGDTDKLAMKPGFSYNKQTNLQKVFAKTMAASVPRAMTSYVQEDGLVSVKLITYMMPIVNGPNIDAAERNLLKGLGGTPTLSASKVTVDFNDSDLATLLNLTVWFGYATGDKIYRLDNATVDSAKINIDINDIATIEWSLTALAITDIGTFSGNEPAHTDLTSNLNYSKNKLSTISLIIGSTVYDLALLNSDITIKNNNIYTGRPVLGQAKVFNNSFTGPRDVSGALGLYLKNGADQGADLLDYLLTNSVDLENSLADITINIGGTSTPRVTLRMPNTILQIPQGNYSGAITLNIGFSAQESTVGAADEITIEYYL